MSTMVAEVIAEARSRTGSTDLGPESFHEGLVALIEGAERAGSYNEIGMAVLRNQAVELLSRRCSASGCSAAPQDGLHGAELPAGPGPEEPVAPDLGVARPLRRPSQRPMTATLGSPRRRRGSRCWIRWPRSSRRCCRARPRDRPSACRSWPWTSDRRCSAAFGDNRHYETWLAGCDMVSAYRYHERVLKLLQWRFPARPWRLKSPAHMDSIEALVEVYPDARFVMTHRDITQVIPSLVSLFDATSELLRTGPLAPDFAANQAAYWERAMRRTLAYRDAGHEDRFFDIGFAEMRPDPIPAIERLYRVAGRRVHQRGRVPDVGVVGGEPGGQAGRPRVPPRGLRHRPGRSCEPSSPSTTTASCTTSEKIDHGPRTRRSRRHRRRRNDGYGPRGRRLLRRRWRPRRRPRPLPPRSRCDRHGSHRARFARRRGGRRGPLRSRVGRHRHRRSSASAGATSTLSSTRPDPWPAGSRASRPIRTRTGAMSSTA